jgi:hypothetical protein
MHQLRRHLARASALLSLAAAGHAATVRVDSPPELPSNVLAKAQEAARLLRTQQPNEAVEVILPPGTYLLDQPLHFGSEDSGTTQSPVLWRAEKPGTVRIVAGRLVKGFAPVTDAAVLERLAPEARDHVRVTDLRAQGITDYGTMSGGFGKDGSTGLEVFVDDQPTTIARYPNEGFIRIRELAGPTEARIRSTRGCKEGWFYAADERVKRWAGDAGAMLHGYWYWDWADLRQPIESIDPETGLIKLQPPYNGSGYRKNQYFYGFNLLSEIDEPGEWYLDRENGKLYIWPPADLSKARVMVTLLPNLVVAEKVANVTFRGIIFEGSREHGIQLKDCQNVRFEACTIRNLGKWAVRVEGGATCALVGCDITATGDGGISLQGGDRKTLTPAKHLAENNHIHHYSRWNRMYRPAISLGGVGNIARHNLIHHAPHQAMNFSGNDQLIEFNEIHNVCEESNDAGAIYAWNDWSARGNVLRYNYFHHIYGHDNKGCMGVYLDDDFSSAHLYGNLFVQVPRASFIGGGQDSVFENNLYVDCYPAVHIDARGLGWRTYGYDELRKKLEKWPYKQPPWSTKYPELVDILDDEPMTPKGNIVRRNICIRGRWSSFEGKAKPYITVEDNIILDENPGFPDMEKPGLGFPADSEIAKLGFQPIPISQIGLRPEPTRASWPVAHAVDAYERPESVQTGGVASSAHPRKPTLTALPATPTVDGKIGANEYPGPVTKVAETPGREILKDRPGTIQVAHDGTYLYVAIQVFAKGPYTVSTPPIWGQNDGLEVCLRTQDGKKHGPTFVLHGFANATFESVTDAGAPKSQADALGKSTRYATTQSQTAWTAEWAIPLADIGAKPGQILGFNVGINRLETAEWLIWAGALSQTWLLDNAGTLLLK